MATLRQVFGDIADAVRAKGVEGTFLPLEMPEKINSIQTGGGDVLGIQVSAFVVDDDGALDASTAPFRTTASTIKPYALAYCGKNKTTFEAPELTSVGDFGLKSFTYLSSDTAFRPGCLVFSAPRLREIGVYSLESAFRRNDDLLSVVMTELETVGLYGMNAAFEGCRNLSVADMPALRTIGNNGMYLAFGSSTNGYGSKLSSAEFPSLTDVSTNGLQYAFQNCQQMKLASFPVLSSIMGNALAYAFDGCQALTAVSLPAVENYATNAFAYAFRNCYALVSVDLGVRDVHVPLGNYAFYGCPLLTSMTFPRAETISYTGPGTFTQYTFAAQTTTLYFPELTAITSKPSAVTQAIFDRCAYLNEIHFPKLSEISASYLFRNCNGLQRLYFSEQNRAAVEASPGYTSKWSAPASCQLIFE